MTDAQPTPNYEAFRTQRLAMLTGPGGSLSMVAMPVISTSDRTFKGLPGTWSGSEAGVTVTAAANEDLQVDGHGLDGTVLLTPESILRFSETVTARVGREVDGTWFLQVADSNAPNLIAFEGVEAYDIDPHWVIDAQYRSRAEADRSVLAGRLGSDTDHQRSSPGDVVFAVDGHEHSLAAYDTFMPGFVTINFTDQTSGSQTPSAGRVLGLRQPADGPVVLDFNQAMLLPHESSSVYPCPMPPGGNDLPLAVTAGERALRFHR